MKIEQFEDIEAWQLARELTRKVYRLTGKPEFAKDPCIEIVQGEMHVSPYLTETRGTKTPFL